MYNWEENVSVTFLQVINFLPSIFIISGGEFIISTDLKILSNADQWLKVGEIVFTHGTSSALDGFLMTHESCVWKTVGLKVGCSLFYA